MSEDPGSRLEPPALAARAVPAVLTALAALVALTTLAAPAPGEAEGAPPRPRTERGFVPPGPTAGDLAAGWAADLAALHPAPDRQIPWLRSATEVRLFLHGLPGDAVSARARIVEASALILARHGRRFEEPRWQAYLASRAWYRPSESYRFGLLSEGEREAFDLLLANHERLSPAPLR